MVVAAEPVVVQLAAVRLAAVMPALVGQRAIAQVAKTRWAVAVATAPTAEAEQVALPRLLHRSRKDSWRQALHFCHKRSRLQPPCVWRNRAPRAC